MYRRNISLFLRSACACARRVATCEQPIIKQPPQSLCISTRAQHSVNSYSRTKSQTLLELSLLLCGCKRGGVNVYFSSVTRLTTGFCFCFSRSHLISSLHQTSHLHQFTCLYTSRPPLSQPPCFFPFSVFLADSFTTVHAVSSLSPFAIPSACWVSNQGGRTIVSPALKPLPGLNSQ